MKKSAGAMVCVMVTMFGYGSAQAAGEPVVEEKVVVDTIWSAVPVGFALLTDGDRQYVAYYDSDRRMAVGQRKLGEPKFSKTVLPSHQGWDSHNYITMAVDGEGYIHLSGNMHCVPLVYFRSTKPGDISTLVRVESMVGRNEKRCTYPRFKPMANGDLLFHYRDGSSGNGVEIYNIYDAKTKRWKRFLDEPLISGLGQCNAYQMGPRLGPDGMFHLVWVWRDTPDCSTTHDISHAQSRDLVRWETIGGRALRLPITPKDRDTIVDAVPVKGGLINMGNGFGFDSRARLLVTYHKYDEAGHDQAYAARFEDGKWQVYPLTDWKHRWEFSGGGSVRCDVAVGSPQVQGEGKLAIAYRHVKYGSGLLIVDEQSLKLLGTEKEAPRYPAELAKVRTDLPGMQVKWRGDSGRSPKAGSRYVLRWETLGPNRDRPRKGKLPANGQLVLYRIGG